MPTHNTKDDNTKEKTDEVVTEPDKAIKRGRRSSTKSDDQGQPKTSIDDSSQVESIEDSVEQPTKDKDLISQPVVVAEESETDDIEEQEIVKRKRQTCILFRKPLRVVYIISFVFAVTMLVIDTGKLIQRGAPITDTSRYATERYIISLIFVAAIGFFGYIILICDVRSMFIGILYMFAATAGLYYCCNAISNAFYALFNDNFGHILSLSQREYERLGTIPYYVAQIQKQEKCCGFGKLFLKSWPELLGTSDIPDSCCLVESKGCGHNLNPRLHSGAIYSFPLFYYLKLLKKPEYKKTHLRCAEDIYKNKSDSTTFNLVKNEDWSGVPFYILRYIDEYYASFDVDINIMCPVWTYNNGIDLFVYKSEGIEEDRRLHNIIFNKSCENNISITVRTKDFNQTFITSLKGEMVWIIGFGMILALLSILMSILFWYYYSRIKANEMAEAPVPRDFQELDLEATTFAGDNKFEDIDDAAAAKLALVQKERQEKLEKKRDLRREEEEAAEKARAEAEAEASRRREKRSRRDKSGREKHKDKDGRSRHGKSSKRDKTKGRAEQDEEKNPEIQKDKKTERHRGKTTEKRKERSSDKHKETGIENQKERSSDKHKETGIENQKERTTDKKKERSTKSSEKHKDDANIELQPKNIQGKSSSKHSKTEENERKPTSSKSMDPSKKL